MSRISMIAAIGARTRALGKDGALLFKIPDDLARFRALTSAHPVIMGRKTWESLPDAARPLPGRANIVMTRQIGYEAPGAGIVGSIEEALALAGQSAGADEIFVIGGGELYALALPHADRLYLTLVESDAPGDAFFPEYPEFTNEIEHQEGRHEGLAYAYSTLERG